MQPYEVVSINPTKKLSEIMTGSSSTKMTTAQNTATKPSNLLVNKNVKKTSRKKLTKKQVEGFLSSVQPPSSLSTSQSKSTSNKLNDKEDQIMRILNYQNSPRFGSSIKKELKFNYTREQLVKKSLEQLDNLLYRIRNYLNTRGMAGIYEQMVRTTAIGYENIVSNFYDIEGFSDMLLNNPAFWDAFERWKIERTLPDIPPSLQLMYIISSTTILAHIKNSNIPQRSRRSDNKDTDKKDEGKEKTSLKPGGTL